jgi:hypothetical protein
MGIRKRCQLHRREDCKTCSVDEQIDVAAQELIEHPENLDAVIAPIADDVFADSSVKNPFAVFRSRIRRIESLLLKAGVPSDQVNAFYRESFTIFDRQNPKLVKRYTDNDNIVPRQNGRR